jgi:hypothetical protein
MAEVSPIVNTAHVVALPIRPAPPPINLEGDAIMQAQRSSRRRLVPIQLPPHVVTIEQQKQGAGRKGN